jgi:hypothetical protein
VADLELTHIVFVLDRSGSMEPLRRMAVDGFNQFLSQQRALPGKATATLVQFSDEVWTTWENLPVSEAVLDLHAYTPGGNTALYDAVGGTIDRVGRKLASLPEAQRPGKVVFAILTDGEENSSRRFAAQDVAKRIRHQTDSYGWEFLFLGASPSWLEHAKEMGIQAADATAFDPSPDGLALAMCEMEERVTRTRGGGARSGVILNTRT